MIAHPLPTRSLPSHQMAYAKTPHEVLGYIIFVRDGDLGKIIKLCVSPAHRCKGIGSTLLDTSLRCLGVPQQQSGGWCVHESRRGRAEAEADEDEDTRHSEHETPVPQRSETRSTGAGSNPWSGAGEESKPAPHWRGGEIAGKNQGEGKNKGEVARKTQGRKGVRELAGGGGDAHPPSVVQLQVDPVREGAVRLYQSRGFQEVPPLPSLSRVCVSGPF
jgi:GNAT superfamily N-acetyltransferase